jgi:serine/threonine protein kinase
MIAKRPFISDVDDINRELIKKIRSCLPNNDVDFYGNDWKTQLFGYKEPAMENYQDFIDLISGMINYYPNKRYSVTQCLNHVFFREHIRHINIVRKAFPPVPDQYHKIRVINCNERLWGYDIACALFNRRKEYKWYDHRVVFQSIDIFDRYLLFLNSTRKRMVQSDDNGYFLSKYEARLTFMVSLYMAIKYFPGMSVPISFTEIVDSKYKTEEALLKAQLIENYLISKVLNYQIYRDTIYDIYKEKLSNKKIRDLLEIVGNQHQLSQDMKLDELMHLIDDL